ncbi:MAG: hypothetical protein K2Z81_19735, partial [Cyanobacteria bacterium]|nr:hypothetical protein [Cyanobacteriota bacterium]
MSVPIARYQSKSVQFGAIVLLAVANSLWLSHCFSVMDNCHDLRSWDANFESARLSLREKKSNSALSFSVNARSNAAALTNPRPYWQITQNQIGDLQAGDGMLTDACNSYRSTISSLKSGNRTDLVAAMQLAKAQNALGLLSFRTGDTKYGISLFSQALSTIEQACRSASSNEEVNQFKAEEMKALLGLIEGRIEDKQPRQVRALFNRARDLDNQLTFDNSLRERLRASARELRQLSKSSSTDSEKILAGAGEATLMKEPQVYRLKILSLMDSPFRTSDDDCLLVKQALVVSNTLAKDEPSQADELLVRLSRRVSPVSLTKSSLWIELTRALEKRR